jgi:hypothetical protein
MNVFMTGATGYIGQHLIPELLRRFEVRGEGERMLYPVPLSKVVCSLVDAIEHGPPHTRCADPLARARELGSRATRRRQTFSPREKVPEGRMRGVSLQA